VGAQRKLLCTLTIEDHQTGKKQVRRVPLENATTAAQAKTQLEELKVERRNGELKVLKQAPKFSEYADGYLQFYKQARDAKRASTLETEGYAINRWKNHLGNLMLNKIKRNHADGYITQRKTDGVAARTINLEVIVFRNVMNKAIGDNWITSLPTGNLRPLKTDHSKRNFARLLFNRSSSMAGEKGQSLLNAQQFSDYIRLMCCSGVRLSETLRLRWADVDRQNRQITIGSDGQAKNYKWRIVDFRMAFPFASTRGVG
jgi:site-specific recombinase XerD